MGFGLTNAAAVKDKEETVGAGVTGAKRILIYRLGSLGDTVIALPALHLVASKYHTAQRVMLTNIPVHCKAPAASSILDGSNLVHGYLTYPVGTRNIVDLFKLWWQIRRFRPDVLIYLTMPRGEHALTRDARFFRACGIKTILGLPTGDRSVNLPLGGDLWESEAGRLVRSLRAIGSIDLDARASWDLELSSAEQAKADEELKALNGRPFLVCGPGTKMQAKDWGTQNWCALMRQLSQRFPDHALVLIGAKDDHPVAETIRLTWLRESVNLCGALSPRESAAVLKKAELFLGPDSGPMHLAGSLGIPCVIAFAARTKPGIWFPRGNKNRVLYRQVDCAECDLETCITQKRKCLTAITVEQMVAAVAEVLGDSPDL